MTKIVGTYEIPMQSLILVTDIEHYPFWDKSFRYNKTRAKMPHLNTKKANGKAACIDLAKVTSEGPTLYIVDGNSRVSAYMDEKFDTIDGNVWVTEWEVNNIDELKELFKGFDNKAAVDREIDNKGYANIELIKLGEGAIMGHPFWASGDIAMMKAAGHKDRDRVSFYKNNKKLVLDFNSIMSAEDYVSMSGATYITCPLKEVMLMTINEEGEIAIKTWKKALKDMNNLIELKHMFSNVEIILEKNNYPDRPKAQARGVLRKFLFKKKYEELKIEYFGE